jgi:hypothetical protein
MGPAASHLHPLSTTGGARLFALMPSYRQAYRCHPWPVPPPIGNEHIMSHEPEQKYATQASSFRNWIRRG